MRSRVIPFLGGSTELEFHRSLLEDSSRTNAFKEAINKSVKKNDVVVDLGAGTGILTFFAQKAGAKKIYSIESQNIIEIAKQIAKKNNIQNNILFKKGSSFFIDLPEKVDVIVSECFGWFLFGGSMIAALIDARNRFLKKGGILIPNAISIYLVPVVSSSHYKSINYWGSKYGIDFSPAQTYANNNVYLASFKRDNFLAIPNQVLSISLNKEDTNETFDINTQFIVSKDATMHGLCGWFDAQLAENILLSTSPLQKKTVWQQAFIPLEKPLEVKKGDVLYIHLSLQRSLDDFISNFEWSVKRNDTTTCQSSFRSYPLLKKTVKKLLMKKMSTKQRINGIKDKIVRRRIWNKQHGN